jgi:hypothetical protein|tara:strand:- start:166 stop:528 length:363 start_codon:yes stop_codon:yes gene_type:complete
MNITQEQEDEMNDRMNIIGQNGNDGDHYQDLSPEDMKLHVEYMKALKKEKRLYDGIQEYLVSNGTTFEAEYQLILNKESGLSGKQRSYLKALQEYEPTQAELDAQEARSKRIAEYEAENK